MRLAFTGDLQAEWPVLSTCRKVWKQIVRVAVERKLEGIVVAGDLKRQYNPVDVRVVKFWQWAISFATESGLLVYVLLGNHDRIGQYADDQNWLSVLQKAGAVTFDKPGILRVGDGYLAALPFRSSLEQLRKDARWLRNQAKTNTVLVFHADIGGAKFNKTGVRSEAKLHAKELYPSQYLACIGGHIHLPQRIGENVYYTGSPFATDWGEANQRKSFIVLEDETVTRIATKVPGWYDESWPDFPSGNMGEVAAGFWQDARVRIHVRCPAGAEYGKTLERARRQAERRYPDAQIFIVPEFEDVKQKEGKIRLTDSDEVKIKEYVRRNTPDGVEMEAAVAYLLSKMDKVQGFKRSVDGIRLKRVEAENFLCFKKAGLKFEPGITLVQGRNEDRQGCSNGSGKTSLLQIAPVTLFGTTFKGQKHDRWAKRNSEKQATCRVVFVDGGGRVVQVVRTRRPGKLQLRIAGVDQSSGLRGDAKDATQGLVEQCSGFTWQTFANAVYIDQEVTRAFLSGKRKEQTEVLSRFQNLERFGLAQIQVRKDKSRNRHQREENKSELYSVQELCFECERDLERLRKQKQKDERELKAKLKSLEYKYEREKEVVEKLSRQCEPKIKRLERKAELIGKKAAKYSDSIAVVLSEIGELENWLADTGHLYKDKTCPTCFQRLDHNLLEGIRARWSVKLRQRRFERNELLETRAKAMQREQKLGARAESLSGKVEEAKDAARLAKERVAFAREQLLAFQQSELDGASIIKEKEKQLKKLQHRRKIMKRERRELEQEARLYEFADAAFGRDGIPAFLNALLVRPLNKAAEYYADLFVDKAIQMRFDVVDGEFDVRVINATGGEELGDQSAGERALAGLIASFALREVAPRCNVLILDEPGDGLDPQTARRFAASLRELQKRFSCIYVTTHNLAILGELSGEKQLTVVKKSGTSSIV